jgi:hypothetical protein
MTVRPTLFTGRGRTYLSHREATPLHPAGCCLGLRSTDLQVVP